MHCAWKVLATSWRVKKGGKWYSRGKEKAAFAVVAGGTLVLGLVRVVGVSDILRGFVSVFKDVLVWSCAQGWLRFSCVFTYLEDAAGQPCLVCALHGCEASRDKCLFLVAGSLRESIWGGDTVSSIIKIERIREKRKRPRECS